MDQSNSADERITVRRSAKLSSKLSDKQIAAAKPAEKAYKLADGNGMYLLVNPNGSKLWRWKYRIDGKEKAMALGEYPVTGLAMARKARDAGREMLVRGLDPMQVRKEEKAAKRAAAENSFRSVATQWWEQWRKTRHQVYASHVWRRLEVDAFPVLGARPIGNIEAPELVMMAKRIDRRGANELARRALQVCGLVFRYAIAHGLAARNPARDIVPSDILPARKKSNMARIDAKELPELLRRTEVYEGAAATRLALKLIALTFVRTSELIGARWTEINLDEARWDIPAERMKAGRPHVVPLARQAVEILRSLKLISGHREYVFPGDRNPRASMSNGTILMALKRMGYRGRMTGHGYRGLASTILHELGFEHAHIEAQLAHQERDAVSAAYNHATYLAQRMRMMQQWADHLDAVREGNVVPLFRKTA